MNNKGDWKTIEVCYSPNHAYKNLGLDFEIKEKYFIVHISFSRKDYIINNNKYIDIQLKNNSIPKSFRKHFIKTFKREFKQLKNIFKTFRQIDN